MGSQLVDWGKEKCPRIFHLFKDAFLFSQHKRKYLVPWLRVQILIIGALALVGEEERGVGLLRLSLGAPRALSSGWGKEGLLAFDQMSSRAQFSVWPLVPAGRLSQQTTFFIWRAVLVALSWGKPCPWLC